MSEYKTFEELKEELGDKFEDYMYKANIELLNQLQQKENIIKEVRKYAGELRTSSSYELDEKVDTLLVMLDKERELN